LWNSAFPSLVRVSPSGWVSLADPGTWGHEYVPHLAAELGDEYTFRETEADTPTPTPTFPPEAGKKEAPAEPKIIGIIEDLRALAMECAVFLIGHNAEPDAVDLLEELEIVDEKK
jgi:26S proteasome regulatory subunit N1